MDHTFGGACGARGVHDEQGMIEWDLFKIQLRLLLRRRQEVVKHTATNQRTKGQNLVALYILYITTDPTISYIIQWFLKYSQLSL